MEGPSQLGCTLPGLVERGRRSKQLAAISMASELACLWEASMKINPFPFKRLRVNFNPKTMNALLNFSLHFIFILYQEEMCWRSPSIYRNRRRFLQIFFRGSHKAQYVSRSNKPGETFQGCEPKIFLQTNHQLASWFYLPAKWRQRFRDDVKILPL